MHELMLHCCHLYRAMATGMARFMAVISWLQAASNRQMQSTPLTVLHIESIIIQTQKAQKVFLLDQLKQDWNVTQGVEAVQQNHEVYECMFEREQSPRIRVLSSPVMLIVIKRSTNKQTHIYLTIGIVVTSMMNNDTKTDTSTITPALHLLSISMDRYSKLSLPIEIFMMCVFLI